MEIVIKQVFFGKATAAAGYAFEYLEDRRRIYVSVTELLDGVAKYTFGESFKDVEGTAYKQIDFLFRCRNKVVHRGEESYRDDNGTLHKVDRPTLKKWFISVETLIKWIDKHRK